MKKIDCPHTKSQAYKVCALSVLLHASKSSSAGLKCLPWPEANSSVTYVAWKTTDLKTTCMNPNLLQMRETRGDSWWEKDSSISKSNNISMQNPNVSLIKPDCTQTCSLLSLSVPRDWPFCVKLFGHSRRYASPDQNQTRYTT